VGGHGREVLDVRGLGRLVAADAQAKVLVLVLELGHTPALKRAEQGAQHLAIEPEGRRRGRLVFHGGRGL
jgi:hypothetical protein